MIVEFFFVSESVVKQYKNDKITVIVPIESGYIRKSLFFDDSYGSFFIRTKNFINTSNELNIFF